MLRLLCRTLFVALLLPLAASPLAAQDKASVEGFRSAKFGMDEAAVRRAAAADFGKSVAIAVETHPLERTKILTLTAEDLVPGSGPARVSYVFGHTSQKLMQVNLLWTGAKPDAGEVTRIRNLVLTLQPYFVQQAWPKDSVATEGTVADGTQLAFRGTDAKGRMVLLRYFLAHGDEKAKPEPPFAALSYVEDPKNPDVFRLKPGQF